MAFAELLDDDPRLLELPVATHAPGPSGRLPLTDDMLRHWPSGDVFGLSQSAAMGWSADELLRPPFLILSTQGGLRDAGGRPTALGFHTGHWEIGLLVEAAAREIAARGGLPFAAACSDPCDGRTQGTTGMFDSLAYRNDAAIVLRRLIRSLPTRRGVLGVATCDKGLPAMMLALAGMRELPGVIVPGGVSLPPTVGEDAGRVQSIGARYAHGELTLEQAAELGCKACASPGGGCQFLGTAATSQVVAEALGLTLPHAALAPSGHPLWSAAARRSAAALLRMSERGARVADLLTPGAIRNAMAVHAAFGGSSNLLMHVPAVAFAAGLPRPTRDDWLEVNRAVPRLVDALPNGPQGHPTVRVFLAGGVPEVMLHLRELGLIDGSAATASGLSWNETLDWWADSPRRAALRRKLHDESGVDPDSVIYSPARARQRGLSGTLCFPGGNLAPEGAVIKSTAIDPARLDSAGVYRHRGPVRFFTREVDAVAAIKALTERPLRPGDVLVLAGRGPLGAGMEEIFQVTSSLRYLSWGRDVSVLTDARFSGVSTGACIGHISPEALAGGPLGRLRDGDVVEVIVDTRALTGSIDLVGERDPLTGALHALDSETARTVLDARPTNADVRPDAALPDDTRLWAALVRASGGVWAGAVYDTERIVEALEEGLSRATSQGPAH